MHFHFKEDETMVQQKTGMLSSWKHTLEIRVKCQKKKGGEK